MKYLLAGDFHGRGVEALRELDFDVLLSTSDFDQPDVIKEFMELKRELESKGKEVYVVPGNHDDAVFRGLNISSGTLRDQGKTVAELHKELQDRPKEESFLEQILSQRKRELDIGSKNAVLVHGALAGDLMSYPDCPPDKRIFWRRLLSREDHRENFREMKSQDYGLMIRGHDHRPEYACHSNSGINISEPDAGDEYLLEKDGLHVVTHGSWFNGWYATIDVEQEPVLRFHNLDQ